MKHGIFTERHAAFLSLNAREVELAIHHTKKAHMTSFYMLRGTAVPDALKELPGFDEVGISGMAGDTFIEYHCYRTPEEVVLALDGKPTIVVKRRSENDYQASLKGNPAIWGCAKTPNSAIGGLISSHADVFGIKVERE